jgi:hypothetical protein
MGVAASLPRATSRSRARLSALARIGAAPLVAGLVVASTLFRGLAGALKETPVYFQDEYLYAELGRSIAETGHPLVRGADAHFPALLQPILTAPAWLLDDVGAAYGLVKWIGALAISLSAVPAFMLARRLGLSRRLALGLSALTLATPSLFYSSWVMGEPFAYPLGLAALAAGTVALADGRRSPQLLFVLLAALATFARVQLIVLPICFLLAALFMGLRDRALRQTLRIHAPALGPFTVAFVFLVAASPDRLLGSYASPLGDDTVLATLPDRLAGNALGVAYASGWVLVPGALLGLVFALTRPRRRSELAFGALATPFALAVLLEASLVGDVDRIQERYSFYLVPVVALSFCLFASRGWPAKRAHALLAAVALAASAAVPLAFHAADTAKTQSAFLFGVHRLEQLLGGDGSGSLAVGGVAAVLSVAVGLLALRPRIATPVALTLAVCFCAAASVLAVDFDRRNTSGVRDSFLPPDASWIDHTGVGEVALVRGLGLKTDAMEQLFWNRSVERVLLLPGAEPFDSFGADTLSVAPDGALFADRRPVRSALLVDNWATRIELHGAVAVASSPGFRLWRPAGTPRLALFVPGYYKDGWLALRMGLNVWAPARRPLAGRFTFVVSAPDYLPAPVRLRVQAGDRRLLEFRLRPGASRPVEVPVCGGRAWFGTVVADRGIVLGDRVVSARATPPRFRPDPDACR